MFNKTKTRPKANQNSVRASSFFVLFVVSLHRYNLNLSTLTSYGGRKLSMGQSVCFYLLYAP